MAAASLEAFGPVARFFLESSLRLDAAGLAIMHTLVHSTSLLGAFDVHPTPLREEPATYRAPAGHQK
jgi:hypothetical protein